MLAFSSKNDSITPQEVIHFMIKPTFCSAVAVAVVGELPLALDRHQVGLAEHNRLRARAQSDCDLRGDLGVAIAADRDGVDAERVDGLDELEVVEEDLEGGRGWVEEAGDFVACAGRRDGPRQAELVGVAKEGQDVDDVADRGAVVWLDGLRV